MAIHLFSTPVQCTNCGTVVDDPKADRCPQCSELLRERRTPGRLVGVDRRYGNLRFLLAAIRFLGVVTLLVGVLLFIFSAGEETIPLTARLLILLGSVILPVALLAIAALFDVAMDVEENTRASFRLQQMILDEMQEQSGKTVPKQPG